MKFRELLRIHCKDFFKNIPSLNPDKWEWWYNEGHKEAKMENELWSIQEKRVYLEANATIAVIGGIPILTTPKGEPLVVKAK